MIIKVDSRNRITIPRLVWNKIKVKAGDSLLVDIQDGIMILIPQNTSCSNHLQGLHCGIWQNMDIEKYINDEREAW